MTKSPLERHLFQLPIQHILEYHLIQNFSSKIKKFNLKNKHLKKGLAITPVKFGISFTTIHLNQAGALVHVYTDGSVHLNHGGIEMGQGTLTKIAQLAANELGLPFEKIKITSTNTSKVPNTSASAASATTDLNGAATIDAIKKIKQNLDNFAKDKKFCQKWIINLLNIDPIFIELIQPKIAMKVFEKILGENFICGFYEFSGLCRGIWILADAIN